MKKESIKRFKLDPKNPPRLSKAEELRLAAMSDEDIDYSDIPELNEQFWYNLRLTMPAKKTSMGLRLDDEILSWFKKKIGKGYQSHINAILRAYMFTHAEKR